MPLINILQIVVSALLITAILFQQRGQSLGSAFGGSGEAFLIKRGLEKKIHIATIFLAAVFVALAVVNLLL